MEWVQYNTGLNSKWAIMFNLSKLWGSLQYLSPWLLTGKDHGVGSSIMGSRSWGRFYWSFFTLKIWMFENKFALAIGTGTWVWVPVFMAIFFTRWGQDRMWQSQTLLTPSWYRRSALSLRSSKNLVHLRRKWKTEVIIRLPFFRLAFEIIAYTFVSQKCLTPVCHTQVPLTFAPDYR